MSYPKKKVSVMVEWVRTREDQMTSFMQTPFPLGLTEGSDYRSRGPNLSIRSYMYAFDGVCGTDPSPTGALHVILSILPSMGLPVSLARYSLNVESRGAQSKKLFVDITFLKVKLFNPGLSKSLFGSSKPIPAMVRT